LPDEGHNQNPPPFAPELVTNNSLNHRANDTRARNGSQINLTDGNHASIDPNEQEPTPIEQTRDNIDMKLKEETIEVKEVPRYVESIGDSGSTTTVQPCCGNAVAVTAFKIRDVLVKYAKFIGPGILISVAYIDPGHPLLDSVCV
jgi:metal iron transporter